MSPSPLFTHARVLPSRRPSPCAREASAQPRGESAPCTNTHRVPDQPDQATVSRDGCDPKKFPATSSFVLSRGCISSTLFSFRWRRCARKDRLLRALGLRINCATGPPPAVRRASTTVSECGSKYESESVHAHGLHADTSTRCRDEIASIEPHRSLSCN